MSLTVQYAVAVNGHIYCENRNQAIPWLPEDMRTVIFDSKTDAVEAAGRIRDDLRTRFRIDPIITVVHRYCSDWSGVDIDGALADQLAQFLNSEGSEGGDRR